MVADERLYRTLGVEPTASAAQIKKAYHQLAKTHHPDRGGDKNKFQEISAAYEVLSNEDRRREYDQHGDSPPDRGGSNLGFAAQTFAEAFAKAFAARGNIFPDGGFQGFAQRSPMVEPITVQVRATLKEAYTGVVKSVPFERSVMCTSCSGVGAATAGAQRQPCRSCQGLGVQVSTRRSSLGFLQQSQRLCDACHGQGYTFPPDSVCKQCRGLGLRTSTSRLDVRIHPGAQDGQRLLVRGYGNEGLGAKAGDVVFVLEVEEASRPFIRDGDNLICDLSLPLRDALSSTIRVEHLDGRSLQLSAPRGKVLQPSSLWRVRNEGMPLMRRPDLRGDLYVRITWDVPPNQADARRALEIASGTTSKPASWLDYWPFRTSSTAEASVGGENIVIMEEVHGLPNQQEWRRSRL
mmetsp:Transcript_29047/g.52914  ORF Transcript_29047/g.52914 Transcript_29047/m.52914 type:complete len:407 (+) Transcript_29047:84-1304(+)